MEEISLEFGNAIDSWFNYRKHVDKNMEILRRKMEELRSQEKDVSAVSKSREDQVGKKAKAVVENWLKHVRDKAAEVDDVAKKARKRRLLSRLSFLMLVDKNIEEITHLLEEGRFLVGQGEATNPTSDNKITQGATMERFLSRMAREKPIRFFPQQLKSFTQGFSTVLGSGGFGVVYKGELPDGESVAVKVLQNVPGKAVEKQFMAEICTIGRTYHINLVRLYGFCFDLKISALVYEYMPNGSLDRFLFGKKQGIEWGKLHQIAIGTAKGIAYMHEECQQRIIHYDIKPGNVLLDANLNPKVADFGLARLCNRESTHVSMSVRGGTPGYAAPELYWMSYPVNHKFDVYSFGMLLFEIVGRRRNHDPNLSETDREWLPRWTWEKFKKNELAEMLSLCGIEEKDRENAERTLMVALWCVQFSPGARPFMSSVVKMLEGGLEITPPPNPFEYMESSGPKQDFFIGSSEDLDPSSSTMRTSLPSCSNSM